MWLCDMWNSDQLKGSECRTGVTSPTNLLLFYEAPSKHHNSALTESSSVNWYIPQTNLQGSVLRQLSSEFFPTKTILPTFLLEPLSYYFTWVKQGLELVYYPSPGYFLFLEYTQPWQS